MEKLITVTTMSEWKEAIQEIGKDGVAVVSWRVLDDESMNSAHSEMIGRARYRKARPYVRPETIPHEIVAPAYEVAKLSDRIVLGSGKVTAAPYIRGIDRSITGLHFDIHTGLPAVTSLAVLEGIIDTYCTLVPLSFLGPDGRNLQDNFIQEMTEVNDRAGVHNSDGSGFEGRALTNKAAQEMLRVRSEAGTIIAFAASGSIEREIHPSAHEIRAVSTVRHTLPLLDINFARYLTDNPAAQNFGTFV